MKKKIRQKSAPSGFYPQKTHSTPLESYLNSLQTDVATFFDQGPHFLLAAEKTAKKIFLAKFDKLKYTKIKGTINKIITCKYQYTFTIVLNTE